MADIIVIGSFVMDAVATMDKYPQAGETVLGKDIYFYPGGKGINQCVTVARMGGKSEMAGSLGNDANGKVFIEIMDKESIKHEKVFIFDKPTAVAQIQITPTDKTEYALYLRLTICSVLKNYLPRTTCSSPEKSLFFSLKCAVT